MVCELCSYEKVTVVHHRDGNPKNNSPGNLQVLCWNCHHLQHHPNGCDGHKKREKLIASNKRTMQINETQADEIEERYKDDIKKLAIANAIVKEQEAELERLRIIGMTAELESAKQKRLIDDIMSNLAKVWYFKRKVEQLQTGIDIYEGKITYDPGGELKKCNS